MAADEQKSETKAEEQQEKKEENEQESISNEAQPAASDQEAQETEQPKVIAYVSPPSRELPSNSAPCLMIETILRMANIPYETHQSIKKSPKTGKFFWISYKGKDVSETGYIVDYLNKEFQVNLNESLSNDQCGVATAYQRLVEESLFWTIVYHRYLMCADESKNNLPPGIRWVASKVARKNTKSNLQAHGMSHHNKEEVYHLAKDDIQAISSYLGEKDFFFGEKPTLIDAILFGSLAQIVWAMPGSPHETYVNEDFTNLKPFCERIKEKYYSDWEDLLAKVPVKASVKPSNGKIEEQTNGDVDAGAAEVNGEKENKEGGDDDTKNEAEAGGEEVKEAEEKKPENVGQEEVAVEAETTKADDKVDETPAGDATETPAEAAEAAEAPEKKDETAAKENSSDEAEK